MEHSNLEKLINKAKEMALNNIWGENAYKINMIILKMDHDNSSAYTRLAKYFRLNDNIEEAKNMYMKVLEFDPDNHGALNNLNDIERYQQEKETIDKISKPSELYDAGQKSARKGKYELAKKYFLKAYEIDPISKYGLILVNTYKKLGEYDKATKLNTKITGDNQ